MNLSSLLLRTAQVFPDRPALAHGERTLHTYGELAGRVARLSDRLSRHFGLKPGSRVGLFMANHPAYLEILYAIWHAGLVAVPINGKLHGKEVAFILEDCGAAVMFTAQPASPDVEQLTASIGLKIVDVTTVEYRKLFLGGDEAIAPCREAGLAWLFYTSGTTGKPKGVMLSHANLLAMTHSYFPDVDAAEAGDTILYAAPMSHGAGLYNLPHVLVGARHVVPESGGFAPDEILALSRHYKRLSLFAAPTMVKRLVQHCGQTGADPTGFKTIVYGGGPMYVEDIRRARGIMGDRFVQIYGQGESPMTITALSRFHIGDTEHPRYLERLGSVGVAQSAVEIRVVDDKGRDLPPEESGEIIVRGGTVMRGYWNNPAATSTTLREGWLYTGDIGALDRDGFLTLRDRSKDLIISGGSNIYPREVEEVLLRHHSITEASVVGAPDADWGEEVVAFVVCEPGSTVSIAELDALCLTHIARFKRPKHYRFLSALPKNNYGKVLKTELRRLLTSPR